MYSLYFFVFFYLQSNSQITKAQTEQMELMDLSAPEVSDEELEPYGSFIEEVRKGQRGSPNRPIRRVSAKQKLQSDVRQQITTDSKRRKMTNTGKKLHNCLECNKNFARSSGLKRHMMTHTGEKPHNCQICNRHFTQSCSLTRHIRIHTGEKPYNCRTCNKNFTSSSDLTRHMRIHTGGKPSNYAICNRNFTDPSNLTRHMRTHSGKKPFNCEKCNKDFARLSELEEHMRIHTGEEQHISRCNESSSDLSHSKDDTMNGIGGKPLCCLRCGKRFATSFRLRAHNCSNERKVPLAEINQKLIDNNERFLSN